MAALAPLPEYIYLRAGHADPQALFLVESSLFTVRGSLPDGCWFFQQFGQQAGSRFPRPQPLREERCVPVYGVPCPDMVMRELLHGMRCAMHLVLHSPPPPSFMDELPDMYRHLPTALRKHLNLATWRKYLSRFGLDMAQVEEKDEDDESRPAKRQKVHPISQLAQTSRGLYIKRAAEATIAHIKSGHPGWSLLETGVSREITACFVYSRDDAKDGCYSYYLPVPGDPPAPHSFPAVDLGTALDGLERRYADLSLDEAVGPRFLAASHILRRFGSRAKKPDVIDHWPLSPNGRDDVTLTPGEHDILLITIGLARLRNEEVDEDEEEDEDDDLGD